MKAKAEVLSCVAEQGPVSSSVVADLLGYATWGGAGATLLRLHRHGHLRRRREGREYLYVVSRKGQQWLRWFARQDQGVSPT